MSINPDHLPGTRQPLTDSDGNPLPPLEVRSPAPNFGNDAQGERLREANRLAEVAAKRRRRNRIIAGIAGGAVLLGGGTAAVVLTGGEPGRPDTSSNGAQPNTDPAEVENTGEAQPITEFGLDVATYEKDPEALARAFNEQLNAFYIAGVDEKVASADERYTMSDSEYVDILSAEIDQEFIDALFVENWQNNPNLVELVDGFKAVAHSTRWGRLVTYAGGTENKEPYVQEVILDEVTGTLDPLTTTARWHGFDNRDMNTVENSMTGVNPNTETGGFTYTWKVVDGQLKISDSEYYAG